MEFAKKGSKFLINGVEYTSGNQTNGFWIQNPEDDIYYLVIRYGITWSLYYYVAAEIVPVAVEKIKLEPPEREYVFIINGKNYKTLDRAKVFYIFDKIVLVEDNDIFYVFYPDYDTLVVEQKEESTLLTGSAFESLIDKLNPEDLMNYYLIYNKAMHVEDRAKILEKIGDFLGKLDLNQLKELKLKNPSSKPLIDNEIQRKLNSNILLEIWEAFPNENWEMKQISANPNITLEYIEFHRKMKWNLVKITENPNLTFDFIERHSNKDWLSTFTKYLSYWNWFNISKHPNITLDIIEDSLNGKRSGKQIIPPPWDWKGLSQNPNLTLKFILDHKDMDWNWYEISKKPIITLDIFEKYTDLPWDLKGLSANPNLTWTWLDQFLSKPKLSNYFNRLGINNTNSRVKIWDWIEISKNPTVTYDIIKRNKDLPWNFVAFLSNPNINYKIVNTDLYNMSDIKRTIYKLGQNLSITWDDILNKNTRIDWAELGSRPDITIDIIKDLIKTFGDKFNENMIDFGALAENPRFTFSMLLEADEIFSSVDINQKLIADHMDALSYNPHLTVNIVRDNYDLEWDFDAMSTNKFTKHPKYIKMAEEIMAI